MVGSGSGIPGPKLLLAKPFMVGSGSGIPGPKLLLAKPFMVGSGSGIPGPKLLVAKHFIVGRGEGIPGPKLLVAKAAEVETVIAATAAMRTRLSFMGRSPGSERIQEFGGAPN